MFVYGESVRQWLAEQLGGVFDSPSTAAIGYQRSGTIVAGAMFEEWNTRSVVCHWAIRGTAPRDWLWYIHHYAFNELRVHKVIAPIYSDNVRMLRIAQKMGFVEEARLKDVQPNGDILIFTMTANNSRYLKMDTTAGRVARSVHPVKTGEMENGKTRPSAACA